MDQVIVYLIGYGGSGKTSASVYLQEKYNFTHFSFSSIIRDFASKHSIPLQKRTDFAKAHAAMLKQYGWDYTISIALNPLNKRVCIDDVRVKKYANLIHGAGGIGIAFHCPTEIRFAHVQNHPDKAKYPATIDQFIQNEHDDEKTIIAAGLEFETAALMESADYHIDASKDLKNTLAQLDTIIISLLDPDNKTGQH